MQALDHSEQLSPRWTLRFKELLQKDLRGPGRESYELSEGTFQPSWIWLVPRLPNPATGDPPLPPSTNLDLDESEAADAMRVHWAKCQARADRYEEEVTLTVEEMGRTLRYFEWKKSQWFSLESEREKSANPPSTWVNQGLHAYAHRQAHVYEALTISYANRWRRLLTSHGLGAGWLHRYPVTSDPSAVRPSRGNSQRKNESDATPVDSALTLSLPNTEAGVDPPMEDISESDDNGGGYLEELESDLDD